MNRAKITIAYDDDTAYTITFSTYNISNPMKNSVAGNQPVSEGMGQSIEITGTTVLFAKLYDKLYNNFLGTWNSAKKGTAILSILAPNGDFVQRDRTFNMAVISSMDIITSLNIGEKVEANIGVSVGGEEGVDDYFSAGWL